MSETVMTNESKPRANWIKPVIVAVVMAALAMGAYVALFYKPAAPNVTFVSLTGEKFTTENLRGRVFMVNFWATNCASCVKEMPELVNTYNQFKGQGLELVAVAMQLDRPDYVVNFTKTHNLPFIVTLDTNGAIAKAFNDVAQTPTTFLIDQDGKIIKRYVGIPDFVEVNKLVQKTISG